MFDNLREQANSTPFYGEEEAQFQPAANPVSAAPKPPADPRFLGMTAPQRFFIAVMLMLVVCLLGTMFLLITGKIGLF